MAAAYPEALERAFLTGVPLQVRVDLSGILVPATVHLCPRGMQPGPPQLWVRSPTLSESRPFPAPPGSPLTVSSLLGGQPFASGTALSPVQPMPGDRPAQPSVLQVPDSLSPQQRRAAYLLHPWTNPLLRPRSGPAARARSRPSWRAPWRT